MSNKKGFRWPNLVLLVATLLVSIFLAEQAVHKYLPRPGFRPFPTDTVPGIIVPDPVLQYRYAPNMSGVVYVDNSQTKFSTNSQGWRDRPAELQSRMCDVLAVGDSFTVGYGVESEQAWPKVVEGLLNAKAGTQKLHVANAGVSAYSLKQIRLYLSELLRDVHPKVVIVGVYPDAYSRVENPFIFYGGYVVVQDQIPHLKITKGGYLYSPYNRTLLQKLDFILKERFWFGAHLLRVASVIKQRVEGVVFPSVSVEATGVSQTTRLEPLAVELTRIKEIVDRAKVRLIVLLINHQEKDGSFPPRAEADNEYLHGICSEMHVLIVDPLPWLRAAANGSPSMRLGGDHHWSPKAHRIAAESTVELLQSLGLLRN
jgi:hypothetical protein